MLFLYRGWNSGTNAAVLRAWRAGVPELDIRAYDVCPLRWDRWQNAAAVLPLALRRGGPAVLRRGTGRFTDAVKRTAWCMKQVVTAVHQLQSRETFDFTFSIGSVLPVINVGRPTFIYSDLTILANLYYPGGRAWVDRWRECLPYERRTLQEARLIFTMSDHVTRSLIEQYGVDPSRVLRVNGGCNVAPIRRADPARFEKKRIVFIGVDWERKGGPELLAAFRRVRRRHPEATLTILGCTPRVRDPGVRVIGFTPPDTVKEFLEQATVFCMPSKREPFGIAYLEAMQAGLPVIGSRFGAAPDFILSGQTGYTVDPTNVEELACRLEEVVANPETARRLGENGRALVEAQYTWERTQRAMWNAIQAAL